MTQGQKESIKRLRESGWSYMTICKEAGLSEGTIKAYCSRNNIGALQLRNSSVCDQCGKEMELQQNTRQKRFCSPQCRSQWWSKNRDKRVKHGTVHICAHCKKEYDSYDSESKYCSHPCYIAHRFGKGAGQP